MCWLHQQDELLNLYNISYCFRGTHGFQVVCCHFGLQLALLLFSPEGHLTVSTTALSLSQSLWIGQRVFLLLLGVDILMWGRFSWTLHCCNSSNLWLLIMKKLRTCWREWVVSMWWELTHSHRWCCCFYYFYPQSENRNYLLRFVDSCCWWYLVMLQEWEEFLSVW